MLRFKFLMDSDYIKLKELLGERIKIWAEHWSFCPDFSIQVCKSFSGDVEQNVKNSLQKDADAGFIFYKDSEFNWEKFIFDDYYLDCPEDELLGHLISHVKNSFFLEIFGFKRVENNTPIFLVNSSFKDFIRIDVCISSSGTIQLLSHESVLHSLINKSPHKSNKADLSRLDAIKDMKITADVFADFGEVEFLDLIHLNKNRLIRSTQEVENCFNLKVNERSICSVALGKIENVKSIVVQGISND